MPFLFVCENAVPVQPAFVAAIAMAAHSNLPDVPALVGRQVVNPLGEKGSLNSP
jgi:hypothetical protein